jgi:hypothetical protein
VFSGSYLLGRCYFPEAHLSDKQAYNHYHHADNSDGCDVFHWKAQQAEVIQ